MFSANRYLLNIDIFQHLLGIETMVGKVAEVSSGDKDYPPAVRPRVHRVPVHLRPPGCFVPACCICGVRYASEWLGVVGDSGQCWWPLPCCYRCCEMPGMPLRPCARSPLGSVALRAEAALRTEAAPPAPTPLSPGVAPSAPPPLSPGVTDLPAEPQALPPTGPACGSSGSSSSRPGLSPLEEF